MSVVHASRERLIYECEKCPKKFSQQFLLKLHQRSHLPYDERQYVCEKCPAERKFVDQNKLKAHMKAVFFFKKFEVYKIVVYKIGSFY